MQKKLNQYPKLFQYLTKYDSREKVVIIYIFHIALCTVNVIAQCVKNEKKNPNTEIVEITEIYFRTILAIFHENNVFTKQITKQLI